MADYIFKVQICLPGNVLETVILRQYIDKVDRCFDRFKTNLIQRYDLLSNTPFKMMWIDNDGDKISIFNEEDLRTFMEMKATKIFVEVDDGTNPTERKPVNVPVIRAPVFRSCRRAERGWIAGDGRYRGGQAGNQEINGNIAPSTPAEPALHAGVLCDGCECEIRGYRYKCIECPDFDLCFQCEMKKLHGDHMMIRIVKPLDRPFNRHYLKAMMKQRCSFREGCEGKDKEKRARHRNENSAFVTFDDIMSDIVKNISTQCTTQSPTSSDATNANQNKANPIDPKQFALNSETFSKAGEVLSNLAQHFVSVMDPFAVHEFIPATPPMNGNDNQNKTNINKPDEPQNVAEENVVNNFNEQSSPMAPSAASSMSPSNTPITPVPADMPKERVTIEDVIEPTPAPRDSSPAADWAVVDSFGHIEEAGDQPKHTGAIPKTQSTVHTPTSSVGSVDASATAQALPNYAVLARDLEDHLHHTLKSHQASQTPPQMPIVHHPNPKINEAIITMTSMGFSNGGGWLTRLLENVSGDIPKALEKLHPSQ